MKLSEYIPLEFSLLRANETRRVQCPECKAPGRTFTVTRTEFGFVWNCFRDSCSAAGAVGSAGREPYAPTARVPRETAYTGPTYPLSQDDSYYFALRFGIHITDSVRKTEDSAYLLPVISPTGITRGYIKRAPTWKGQPVCPALAFYDTTKGAPKTINYLNSESEVPLSWHGVHSKHVVLVEDWCSAQKLAELGLRAVALLGSSLSDARVRELQQWKVSRITWAPDPDAIGTALKHSQKYSPAFDRLRVAFLECDPKDYTDSSELLFALGDLT